MQNISKAVLKDSVAPSESGYDCARCSDFAAAARAEALEWLARIEIDCGRTLDVFCRHKRGLDLCLECDECHNDMMSREMITSEPFSPLFDAFDAVRKHLQCFYNNVVGETTINADNAAMRREAE